MAVLGLILLAAAGVLTAAVVTSNTGSLSVDLWSVSVSNVTLGVVFVAGMITTVLAVVGLGLLMGGLRRNRRLRKERRSLRRENEQLVQQVDSTPPAHDPTVRYDDRTQVVHDDSTRVESAPHQHAPMDRIPGEGATSADSGSGRRFLPRREDQARTDSGPRDN